MEGEPTVRDALNFFQLRRRTTLKLIVGAGLGWRWGIASATASGSLLTRKIPSTGETLPAIGLGTSDEFSIAPGESVEPLREVLQRFVELGGRMIDTAPAYGNAEEVIGRLVGELGIGDRVFMATKIGVHGKAAGVEQMQRSEQLLKKRPLDLIQVHSLIDVGTQLENLRRWKDAGRTRYVGITASKASAFTDLERLMRSEKLDFVQLNYSFTEPDAEKRLLPLAADKGIAVITNRPFENGALFTKVKGKPLPAWASEFDCRSWAQFSLKYILSHPAVTCVIPATSNPRHLIDNMAAGVGALPDARTRERMRELGAVYHARS